MATIQKPSQTGAQVDAAVAATQTKHAPAQPVTTLDATGVPYTTTHPLGVSTPGSPTTNTTSTASITPTTQANTSPTIPTSAITSPQSNKLDIPDTPSTGTNTAIGAISKAGSINESLSNSQSALLNTQDAGVNQAQANYNNDKSTLIGMIGQYLGKGQAQATMENDLGIPKLREVATQLSTQYNTQQLAYNAQYNSILNAPYGTLEQKAQQISALQQQHGYDLTDTAIKQSLAMTNYTAAQDMINHQIDIKYAPMKDAIDFGMQFLSQNKDILTQKQAQSFQANLAVQNQMYTQGQYYDHLTADTKVQMVKDAAALGAPADVQQAIWDANSIGDAASAGGQYLQNSNYSVVQTGVDQSTGLPIYSRFNPKNGQMEPLNLNGALGGTGSTDTVVNGYQLGATTTLGAYASDTNTQVNNVKATVARIDSYVGPIVNATDASLALKVIAPNSPVTGDMVMNAAAQYSVDPATIIGIMQAETRIGTDGSKGSKQNNWGNVGNTDALMASGGSVAMTPQQGVDAVAKNLAMRQVQPGQNDPAQPTQPDATLTPSQQAQVAIKNAPALLQPAMNTTSTGGVFIDASKVPGTLSVMSQSYASRSGVPILTSEQVAVVKGADEAARNITQVIAPAWNEIAPNSVVGEVANQELYAGFGKLFNTDKYAKNNTFKANQESLAQQIRALAQSTPKAGLLETAENALPTNAGYFKHGSGYDTLKTGTEKMQRTLDLLTQTVKTYLPNSAGYSLEGAISSQAMTLNGVQYVQGADGKYYAK